MLLTELTSPLSTIINTVDGVVGFNKFPATDVLGYGLDFTTASPLDIKSVLAAVKRDLRIIQYEPDQDTRKVVVGGTVYDVPKSIDVTNQITVDGSYATYKSGTEASSALKVDTSLSPRYLAVSASDSLSYSIDKTYRKEDQWAMYALNADTYRVSLRDYTNLLAETALEGRLKAAVPIGDGSNKSVVQEWKDFFASYGSHPIINAGYGARYQLNVWASNSDATVNKRFATNVTAAFNGIGAGGQFDPSVITEDQYKTFSEFMQKQVSVVGGNPELNKKLTADPTRNDIFAEWALTVAADPSIATLNVTELWNLMKNANSQELRDASGMVMDAYNYIVQNPQQYKTAVVLDIQSDWAEFNLLSPGSVIIQDPDNPVPPNTVASNTRIQWGRYAHNYARQPIRFFVINDGSAVDFSTSHGSNGAGPQQGKAVVIINGTSYPNDQITDNVWNTQWFYQKATSSTPASTGL